MEKELLRRIVEISQRLERSETRDRPAKNNYAAITAPTASNDGAQGYSVGSEWINTALGDVYKCVNATTGAAVWRKLN